MKIPKRYENVDYEKDVPQEIKEKLRENIKAGKGLYIQGDVGVGKTHIAYAIVKEATGKGFYPHFFNMAELLFEIRADFGRSERYKKFFAEDLIEESNQYTNVNRENGLLILDDIGAEKISDWVAETIYLIVNKRYENMKPTIFTSNFSIADLAERIGDRTVSRIVEMCDIIKLEGKDRRL